MDKPTIDRVPPALAAAQPFDPATFLDRSGVPLPYATGPAVEVRPVFDPAANLGTAARRGPASIGDGKPLVARIGGVEVVTVPVDHYAALLTLVREGTAPKPDDQPPHAQGMFNLLASLHMAGTVSVEDFADATGLGREDAGARAAAVVAATAPDAIRATPTAGDAARVDFVREPEEARVEVPSQAGGHGNARRRPRAGA